MDSVPCPPPPRPQHWYKSIYFTFLGLSLAWHIPHLIGERKTRSQVPGWEGRKQKQPGHVSDAPWVQEDDKKRSKAGLREWQRRVSAVLYLRLDQTQGKTCNWMTMTAPSDKFRVWSRGDDCGCSQAEKGNGLMLLTCSLLREMSCLWQPSIFWSVKDNPTKPKMPNRSTLVHKQ